MLVNADDATKTRLMRSFSELEKIVDYLDADQSKSSLIKKIGEQDDPQVWKKTALSVNELAGSILRESAGVENVTWDTIE